MKGSIRKLKKEGKKYYGKNHFYVKLISKDSDIPDSMLNAGVPGYCFESCKNSDKIVAYKDY